MVEEESKDGARDTCDPGRCAEKGERRGYGTAFYGEAAIDA